MRDFVRFWPFGAVVLVFAIVVGIAALTAQPHARPQNLPATQTDPHYIDVPTPHGNVPCIVYVNEYHPENGAAISCDWSKR